MLCPGCRGKKTVAPLGAIEKQCSTCKGIGHVNDDVMIETPIVYSGVPTKEVYEKVMPVVKKPTDEPLKLDREAKKEMARLRMAAAREARKVKMKSRNSV